jgi:WD40 repeat protein
VGTENGTVEVIEPDGNQFTLDVGNREVFGLAVTDEGLVAAGDREGRLTLWDGPDRIAVDIRFHDNRILDIALSPDGQYLATAGSDGRIGLWSATDLDLVRSIGELGTEINGLAFTPGGDLVSADLAGRISFWDVNGGQSRSQIQWPDSLFAIAVDPTGTWIAAAGGDEAIAVVELDSGDVLQRLTPLAGGASDVAFTDGGVVAGLSRRGSVAIWNPMSGEQLGPISRVHDDNSDSWSLMIDEHLGIWSAGEDGLLHRLDVLDRTIACDISMDVFDDQRRSKFLDDQPLQSCTSETP